MSFFIYGNSYLNDNIQVTTAFEINNAGYTQKDKRTATTYRPSGRHDYQLIFVKKGILHFDVDGKDIPLKNNTIYIYHPYEPQNYTIFPGDNTEYLWVHFGGYDTETLLTNLNLFNERIFSYENSTFCIEKINIIIAELKERKIGFKEVCTSTLKLLLCDISRHQHSNSLNKHQNLIKEIYTFIANNYQYNFSMNELANEYQITSTYMAKIFKDYYGTTPLNIRNNMRIQTAKTLLLDSDLKIYEVAKAVGYNDELYFSKVFKSATGNSPSEYRKNKINRLE